jgi:hypothetical protein
MNIFKKIFDAIKNFITRPGMVKFLKDNLDEGIDRVQVLIAAKGGLAAVNLHDIDGEIFAALKAFTSTDKDNWVVGLKVFVVEALKAGAAQEESAAADTKPLDEPPLKASLEL